MCDPIFEIGQVVATPAALEAINSAGETALSFLQRHASGDWGDVCPEDSVANEKAVEDGSRILSAYRTASGTRIWVITEMQNDSGHRAATTILLPEEY